MSLLSPISYLICASIAPVLLFRQSRIPSHQPFRKSVTKNASQSVFYLPAVTSHSQASASSLLLNFLKKFNQKPVSLVKLSF